MSSRLSHWDTTFSWGMHSLRAGYADAAYVQLGVRASEKGGADVPAAWATPRGCDREGRAATVLTRNHLWT